MFMVDEGEKEKGLGRVTSVARGERGEGDSRDGGLGGLGGMGGVAR